MTDDYLPMLRGTALIDVPPRTVAGVVAEAWLMRQSVAPLGVRINAEQSGQLGAGDELSVTLRPFRLPLRLRVDRADETGILLTGNGCLPRVQVSATVTPAQDGTLLTYGIGWLAPGGGLGRWLDFALGRRLVLRLIPALLTGARTRAVQLATAPVVVGAVIHNGTTVLAAQRDRPHAIAGRWEFPGGQVESGEDERSALARECREELAADVEVTDRLGPDLVLPNGWLLRLYTAHLAPDANPVASEHRAIRWVPAAELDTLNWLDADRLVLPSIHTLLRTP